MTDIHTLANNCVKALDRSIAEKENILDIIENFNTALDELKAGFLGDTP
jgi:hypothetical protein